MNAQREVDVLHRCGLRDLEVELLRSQTGLGQLMKDRAAYNASGVAGVLTPGVSFTLTTKGATKVPVTGVCQSNPVAVLSGSATAQYANSVGQSLTAFGTIISCPPNNFGPAECKITGICSYHDGFGLGGSVFGKRTAAGSYDCQ